MASTLVSYEGFRAYAQDYIESDIQSSLFTKNVILTILAGVSGQTGAFGRPGTYVMLGGKKLTKAQKKETRGSIYARCFFLTGTVGGGRWKADRDTSTSTGQDSQDQKRKGASFAWAEREDPIKVWKDTKMMSASNKYQIAAPVDDAVNQAKETHMAAINTKLYTGNPTTQSDDKWDEPIGLQQMCHTTNTYGNVSRSTYTAWAGKRNTTAQTASLDIVEQAATNHDGAGTGMHDNGPGANLWVTTNLIFSKLRRQAKAEGVQIVRPEIPTHGTLGFMEEYIQDGKNIIVPDPSCPANHMFGLCTDSLVFECHPGANFKVADFFDQSKIPGGDDAFTSNIKTWMRFWTAAPHHHIVYTAVSV